MRTKIINLIFKMIVDEEIVLNCIITLKLSLVN